jgi:uncharacterized protein (AIM24 family)
MARFDIIELEGMRFVQAHLEDESMRAEAGALSYMRGDIRVDAAVPGLGQMIKCALSNESPIRPRYEGTGDVFLQSSFGGYHSLDVKGEAWILENGAYWASAGTVELGLYREPALTSYWAGEGFIDYQTRVSGKGVAVLNADGPVEEMHLRDESLSVEGKLVIARTEGLRYRVRRPTRSLIGYWLSGEEMMRTYSGTGRVLVSTTPYWNQRLLSAMNH